MDGDEAETLIWADLAAGDSGEWEVEIASGKVLFRRRCASCSDSPKTNDRERRKEWMIAPVVRY
jgi:hypothetical protein